MIEILNENQLTNINKKSIVNKKLNKVKNN